MESENKTYTLAITHNPPADFELTGVAARDLSFLASANLDIVPSFVITGHSFDLYLEHNGIVPELVEQINLAAEYPKQTKKVANAIRDLFRSGTFPTSLKLEIAKEYESISKGKDPLVNLSQSPLNIDLDERSFLEKRGEWLNVQGEEEILKAVREVWASLFSKEALDYRNSVNYEGSLSQPVLVQKMLNADLSGQTYNFDTNTGVEHVSTSRVNLGISLEPSLASKDADYYSVKKANAEAVAVVNLPQKFMQVRSQHSGETTKVKVSKAWSERR
ncbi:MAG: PEP/pyruvate-binding domain-containing protein, partial [Candidatus Dojkabacteria bacterium]